MILLPLSLYIDIINFYDEFFFAVLYSSTFFIYLYLYFSLWWFFCLFNDNIIEFNTIKKMNLNTVYYNMNINK